MSNVELVVKIPEIEYEHLTNQEKFDSLTKNKQEWLINKILNRVIDGISLPKGHGNLVDYEKLKNNAREYGAYTEATLSHIKPKIIIEANKEQEDGNYN